MQYRRRTIGIRAYGRYILRACWVRTVLKWTLHITLEGVWAAFITSFVHFPFVLNNVGFALVEGVLLIGIRVCKVGHDGNGIERFACHWVEQQDGRLRIALPIESPWRTIDSGQCK